MGFNFGLRANAGDSVAEGMRADIRSRCTQTSSCAALFRTETCACYPEFSARLWLQVGAFPKSEIPRSELVGLSYKNPASANLVETFLKSPELVLGRGWNAVIYGGSGSGKTGLATFLVKSVMRWKTMNYTASTRCIYFPFPEYKTMCDRAERPYSSDEKDYLTGAVESSIMVWDDVSPQAATYPQFLADVKSRSNDGLPTILVLRDPLSSYIRTELGEFLNIVQNGSEVYRPNWCSIGLQGRVLAQSGWS